MNPSYVIGVDVGTGSARAGLFDAAGYRLATHSHPIQMWRPLPGYAEQSSTDIWSAIAISIRECLSQAKVTADQVVGISFDATCSLVVLDENGLGLSVNLDGDPKRDIIVWMDHRAVAETDKINSGSYNALRYAGGKLSPEMQTPKLLWLKKNLPHTWSRAAHFFDLADYLTWRATGSQSRSLCTVVCKWTYMGEEHRWDSNFFRSIGLGDILGRIGNDVQPMGTRLGFLTPGAAQELGLTVGCVVGQGIIDAHAGGLGMLGSAWAESEGTPLEALESTLALIGGTSNCHMAVSREARFVPGVWGPYSGAMVPGMWLSEGGQTTAGAAIDFAIADHAHAPALREESERSGKTVYELLNTEIARQGGSPTLTRDFHVLPYFLGNRSPHADPHARAVYDGILLDNTISSQAIRYYATLQAVAYGTRDIIETLNANGYSIDTVFVTGGATKNPLWLQEHADATGATLILPEEPEAVLLGTAVLAATAAGLHRDVYSAMKSMSRPGQTIVPRPEYREYHGAKFQIFRELYQQQRARKARMSGF